MTDRETLIDMLTRAGTTFTVDIDSVEIERDLDYIYFIFDTKTGEIIKVSMGSTHYSD